MRKKKVLFVCTANYYRSVTAERIFKDYENLEVKSAGTHPLAERTIDKDLIDWADLIFAMEEEHKEAILTIAPEAEYKIIVLDIPDIYGRMDPFLIRILKEKVSKYL